MSPRTQFAMMLVAAAVAGALQWSMQTERENITSLAMTASTPFGYHFTSSASRLLTLLPTDVAFGATIWCHVTAVLVCGLCMAYNMCRFSGKDSLHKKVGRLYIDSWLASYFSGWACGLLKYFFYNSTNEPFISVFAQGMLTHQGMTFAATAAQAMEPGAGHMARHGILICNFMVLAFAAAVFAYSLEPESALRVNTRQGYKEHPLWFTMPVLLTQTFFGVPLAAWNMRRLPANPGVGASRSPVAKWMHVCNMVWSGFIYIASVYAQWIKRHLVARSPKVHVYALFFPVVSTALLLLLGVYYYQHSARRQRSRRSCPDPWKRRIHVWAL